MTKLQVNYFQLRSDGTKNELATLTGDTLFVPRVGDFWAYETKKAYKDEVVVIKVQMIIKDRKGEGEDKGKIFVEQEFDVYVSLVSDLKKHGLCDKCKQTIKDALGIELL